MSLRCAYKNGLTDSVAVKGFGLLDKYADSGVIPEKELDEELLLFFESEKLALPVSSLKDSLSWGTRNVVIQDLEIPYIIREIVKSDCNWKKAVLNYFTRIGEKDPQDFIEIVWEIINQRKNFLISGNEIVRISQRFGRDGGVVIAELKGAGIISPYSGCGRAVSKLESIHGSPLYEINRFLIKIIEKTSQFT